MEEERRADYDRISALPDPLIHHILSHLDMKEVVHTSILSNRWRYIWLSTPYLDFNLDYWHPNSKKSCFLKARQSFMNFVENALIRMGNIMKLRLYTYDYYFDFDLPRVSSWINMCLERNVQHLILRFPLGSFTSEEGDVDLTSFLPPNLFTSNLTTLEISFVRNALVPLPNIVLGSVIKDLQLHGVVLPDGNADGQLDLNYTVLEILKIDLCGVNHLKVLNVSAPLLQKLWVRLGIDREEDTSSWWSDAGIDPQENVVCNVKVNLDTPIVESLVLVTFSSEESFPVDYSIEGELLSLVSAQIHIFTETYADEECSQHLIMLLHKVYHARQLHLTICTKQVLNDFPILLEELPHQFQNLRYIRLGDGMKFPCFQAITNFLSSFPHIETFVWERTWNKYHGVTNEAGESLANGIESLRASVFASMFGCLKTVGFEKLEGSELELEFVAFVLERAVLLKKVTIQFDQTVVGAKLTEFKEKCLCLPRASPNADIVFGGHLKTPPGWW